MKKAFTIVELLMVIGIISVLITLVTRAATGSMMAMREHRADAGRRMLQQGLATYYAQKGYWPGEIGQRIRNGTFKSNTNPYPLTAGEVDGMFRELIQETKRGNPMLDFSGLVVSRSQGEMGDIGTGLDFWSAVHGTKKSKKRMSLSEMHFGYVGWGAGGEDGYKTKNDKNHFRRFLVEYSVSTDEMTVKTQCPMASDFQ